MSELRQNLITRDWVIIASERGNRPRDFVGKDTNIVLPSRDPACPFCPGNEDDTEGEIFRLGSDQGWQVRVVANKYPALRPSAEGLRQNSGLRRSMGGVGAHEVIIEHTGHNLTTALLDTKDIARILWAYRERYSALKRDPRLEAVILFKNHGKRAGTSLRHPHSQLTATPIVPNQVRHRIEEAIRFYDDTGQCVFCRTLDDELKDGARLVTESPHFAAFVPYAALSPFHTWIFPRRHASSFEEITDAELHDLANVLKLVLAKLYYGLNDPDYNYVIRSIPTHDGHTSYFHWYLSIVPRIVRAAGFELGSGMYINPSSPEQDARFLRQFNPPTARPQTVP
jgi:UDPglucose--hexose-1-phosphate uridylyltransferase